MASSDPPPPSSSSTAPPGPSSPLSHTPLHCEDSHSTKGATRAERGEGGRGEGGGGDSGSKVTCVLHLTPQWVVETEEYLSWMASLGPSTHHVLRDTGR